MFPSIPVMSRRINGDSNVIVDGYKVPSGTNVIMLNYQLHQDERFLRGAKKTCETYEILY